MSKTIKLKRLAIGLAIGLDFGRSYISLVGVLEEDVTSYHCKQNPGDPCVNSAVEYIKNNSPADDGGYGDKWQ
jgi:hypothetical protein